MINIYGFINNLGYGILTTNLVKALVDLGEEVALLPVGEVQLDSYYEFNIRQALDNFQKYYNRNNPTISLLHDHMNYSVNGKKLFGLSMFETTKLKDDSLRSINSTTDVVLTTTKDHKTILQELTERPVEVLNGGIDPNIYNIFQTEKLIDTNKFTFFLAGKNEKRKNTDIIIESFLEESVDKEVALICHTFNPFLHKNRNEHAFKNLYCWTNINPQSYKLEYKGFVDNMYHLFSNGKCDIYFTIPGKSLFAMPKLYSTANVGLSCSSNEGWDLPCHEMASMGIPQIATTCLGHTEFMPKTDLTIECTELEIANDNLFFNGTGEWYKISKDYIKDKIRYVLGNTDKYLTRDATLAEYTSKFSWETAAKSLLETINKHKD